MLWLQTHNVAGGARPVQQLRTCGRSDVCCGPETANVILGADAIVTEVQLEGWIAEGAEVELEVSWVGDVEQDEV